MNILKSGAFSLSKGVVPTHLAVNPKTVRFGGFDALVPYRQTLQPVGPGVESFMRGEIPLRKMDGQVATAHIEETSPKDAAAVDAWYDPAPDGGPSYSVNPKWREWWAEKITQPTPGWTVFKLVDPNNVILGVVTLLKGFVEQPGAKPLTWVKGIRIAPRCNSMMTQTPDYKGVGSALMAQAMIKSIENGDDGIGLNSTLGAEGFYQAMNMRARASLDGIRTSFFCRRAE